MELSAHHTVTATIRNARKFRDIGDWGKATSYYLVGASLDGRVKHEIEEEFLRAFKAFCEARVHDSADTKPMLHCCAQAEEVFSGSAALHQYIGSLMYRLGLTVQAAAHYRRALTVSPALAAAQENLDNVCSSLVDRWHFIMLNDGARNSAYERAMRRAVKGGCQTVLDIGSGTGILSMMAAAVGAGKIYGCDDSQAMYDLSQKILLANKHLLKSEVQLFNLHSDSLRLGEHMPKKADLVVTETLDSGLFGERILSTLSHAHKHLLSESRPPARVIPAAASLYCTVVECDRIRRHHSCADAALQSFQDITLGDLVFVDYTSQPAEALPDDAEFDPYTTYSASWLRKHCRQLSSPCKVMDVDFNDEKMIDSLLKGVTSTLKNDATSAGRPDAVIMWFTLYLDDDNHLSTNPFYPPASSPPDAPPQPPTDPCLTPPSDSSHAICWQPACFPVNQGSEARTVRVGDDLDLCVRCQNDVIKLSLAAEQLESHQSSGCHGDEMSEMAGGDRPNSACHPEGSGSNGVGRGMSPYYLTSSEIYRLNDAETNTSVYRSLKWRVQSLAGEDTRVLVIDTDFSLFPVQVLKAGASQCSVINSNRYHRKVLGEVAELNGISKGISFLQDCERCSESARNYDVIYADVVGSDGTLKQHILSDISLARLMSADGVVVPGKVKVFGAGIVSPQLTSYCRVLGEERTCGFDVRVINEYQTSVYKDIELDSLDYRLVTSSQELLSLDLNSPVDSSGLPEFMSASSAVILKADRPSHVSAVLFWFEIWLDEGTRISTLDGATYWNQSALVFSEDFWCGGELKVSARISEGCLGIRHIKQHSSSAGPSS